MIANGQDVTLIQLVLYPGDLLIVGRRQIKPGNLAPEAAGHRLQLEAGWVGDGANVAVHWTAFLAGEGFIDEEGNIKGLVRLPFANPDRRWGDVRIWIGSVC